jgi:hypothetical protein
LLLYLLNASLALVCGVTWLAVGRWKQDMFEEILRREEVGADPEVRYVVILLSLHCQVLVAAVAGGGRWKHDMFEKILRREEVGADPEVRSDVALLSVRDVFCCVICCCWEPGMFEELPLCKGIGADNGVESVLCQW